MIAYYMWILIMSIKSVPVRNTSHNKLLFWVMVNLGKDVLFKNYGKDYKELMTLWR